MDPFQWIAAVVILVLYTWVVWSMGCDRGYIQALRFLDQQLAKAQAEGHMVRGHSQCNCLEKEA